jgi:formyl-CoA transferase
MELTGEREGSPQVLGIPLPDMGTSEHAYGLLMKALYRRQVTGEGACIALSMLESSVSWLTVPITLSTTFGKPITRRGNTHEFFCPVSVYRTKDGFVYLAVGNDRQWKSMVDLDAFKSLADPKYEKNAGRIAHVEALNEAITKITEQQSSEELIALFQSITVPISVIKKIPEVVADPLVARRLLQARDARTGLTLTLAPPPHMTPFLDASGRELRFPPRFGEHNDEILGGRLGYGKEALSRLKEEGMI